MKKKIKMNREIQEGHRKHFSAEHEYSFKSKYDQYKEI